MSVTKIAHPSVDERRAEGKACRERAGLDSHVGWAPAADRPDPVALLEEQNATREPDLVPVRHGRMMVSPFTFYRGAAKIMAADLKDTPTAGLNVQLCGDAHLSNFGVFASPERTLLFDLNDFDETLPGPFEYDVKRMAASFTIAARNNGFTAAEARAATRRIGDVVPRAAWPSSRRWARWTSGTHGCRKQDLMNAIDTAKQSLEGRRTRSGGQRRGEGRAKDCRQGAHPRQPAGAVEARRARRRPVPDRQPAADHHPGSRDCARDGLHARRGRAHHARAVPQLPRHAAGRPPPPAGTVRARRRRAQGRRCRQRRHPCVHRVAAGPRPAGPAVPAGQGSDPFGARRPPAEEPLPASPANGSCRANG